MDELRMGYGRVMDEVSRSSGGSRRRSCGRAWRVTDVACQMASHLHHPLACALVHVASRGCLCPSGCLKGPGQSQFRWFVLGPFHMEEGLQHGTNRNGYSWFGHAVIFYMKEGKELAMVHHTYYFETYEVDENIGMARNSFNL